MKIMKGESPGWHVMSPADQPVSGPWIAASDAAMHAKAKGPGHYPIQWSGAAVVAA